MANKQPVKKADADEKLKDEFLFKYDQTLQVKNRESSAKEDPEYFKYTKISSLALLKMLLHARSACAGESADGKTLEVMGMLLGKTDGNSFIIVDTFPIKKGDEASVQLTDEDYEYIVDTCEKMKKVGRMEEIIGWYHSHPALGVFLSGTDIRTQRVQQQFQDPYLAIVIDPISTISTGKPRLGAFRTYPKDYKPKEPVNWVTAQTVFGIDDPGYYKDEFYPLEISVFKSSLDTTMFEMLWNKYWVKGLASSKNLLTREYSSAKITDVAVNLERVGKDIGNSSAGYFFQKRKRRMHSFSKYVKKLRKFQSIRQMVPPLKYSKTFCLIQTMTNRNK